MESVAGKMKEDLCRVSSIGKKEAYLARGRNDSYEGRSFPAQHIIRLAGRDKEV
jgi:hypothetical protein